jgi:hypothetical protein
MTVIATYFHSSKTLVIIEVDSNLKLISFLAGIAVLNNFCGGRLITATAAPFTGTANKTICSKTMNLSLTLLSYFVGSLQQCTCIHINAKHKKN